MSVFIDHRVRQDIPTLASRKYSTLTRAGPVRKSAMAKKKQEKFSVTKAVKRNARERVGQPKPAKVITSEPQRERRERRHKKTLADLLKRED
jgi:hypothetical protein